MADAPTPAQDQVIATVADAAPAPESAAPVVAPPAAGQAAPVAEVSPAPEVKSVEDVAPVVPSLLEEAGKKPAVEAPKADAAPAPEPAPVESIKWEFDLPETLKADEATLGRFRENLDALVRPKEGETPSQAARRLLDMHAEAMSVFSEQGERDRKTAWNAYQRDLYTKALADPQIGGAGHETAMGAIARVRDAGISNAKFGSARYNAEAKEFNDMLRTHGVNNHPAMLRFIHNLAAFVDEPSMPSAKASPPPNAGKRPGRNLYPD